MISAPAFTFAADSVAAFPELTCIIRLDARTLPPQLPAGLKHLVLEGDGQELTTLPSDVVSNLQQLERLALFNMAVDIEQLPRSLAFLDLIKCAVPVSGPVSACTCASASMLSTAAAFQLAAGLSHLSAHNMHCTRGWPPAPPQHTCVCCSVELGPKLSEALQAFTRHLHPRQTREIWKAGPEARLVESCTLKPHWDSSGNFVVKNAELSHHSFYSTESSPHAAYISMYMNFG